MGSAFVDLGSATATAPAVRPTTGSLTVLASPSTRWVWAVFLTSTTLAIDGASGVWTTTTPPGCELTPVTTGRFGSAKYGANGEFFNPLSASATTPAVTRAPASVVWVWSVPK